MSRGATIFGMENYVGGHGFLAPGIYIDEYDMDFNNVQPEFVKSIKVDPGIVVKLYQSSYLSGLMFTIDKDMPVIKKDVTEFTEYHHPGNPCRWYKSEAPSDWLAGISGTLRKCIDPHSIGPPDYIGCIVVEDTLAVTPPVTDPPDPGTDPGTPPGTDPSNPGNDTPPGTDPADPDSGSTGSKKAYLWLALAAGIIIFKDRIFGNKK
jgi:hypothetical protein